MVKKQKEKRGSIILQLHILVHILTEGRRNIKVERGWEKYELDDLVKEENRTVLMQDDYKHLIWLFLSRVFHSLTENDQ